MANYDDEDELDLDEEEQQRRKQAAPVATPTSDAIGTPLKQIATSSSPLSSELTPPQQESIGTPLQLSPAPAARPNYEHYESLLNEPRKSWSDLGIGGKIGRVAEGIGTAIVPNIMNKFPGTAVGHQAEVGRAQKAAEEENANIASQGNEAHLGAETTELQARAKKEANPPEKVGATPEEVTIHDLMTGNGGAPRVNPKTQMPYTYMDAYTDVMSAKQGVKPPAKPDTPEQQYIDEFQKKHPGASIQDALKQYHKDTEKEPEGSYMPLYDEKGHVIGAWNPKKGNVVKGPEGISGTTAAGSHIATQADAAQQKAVKPYQDMLDAQNEAHQLADMGDKGNAEADVNLALSFFKMMKGAQGSGVRFTQQENNLIMHSRSLGQDLLGVSQKVIGEGQPFTPDQRHKIVQIIDMHGQAAQQAIQRLQGAGGGGNVTPPAATGGIQIERDANGRIVGVH